MDHIHAFRIPGVLTAGILLSALIAVGGALAQENPPGVVDSKSVEPEVDAIAPEDLSQRELRRAYIEAEDEFYRLFNEFNLDDEYDIICRKEKRVTSHFSKRVCQARLFRETVEEMAHDFSEEGVHRSASLDEEYHTSVLHQKIRNLAAAHPDLRAALERYRDLKQELDTRKR